MFGKKTSTAKKASVSKKTSSGKPRLVLSEEDIEGDVVSAMQQHVFTEIEGVQKFLKDLDRQSN